METLLFVPQVPLDSPPQVELPPPKSETKKPRPWLEPVVLLAIAIGLFFVGAYLVERSIFGRGKLGGVGFITELLGLLLFVYAVGKGIWRIARLKPRLLLWLVPVAGVIALVAGISHWQSERGFRAKFVWDEYSSFSVSKNKIERAQKAVLDKLITPKTATFSGEFGRRQGDLFYVTLTLDCQNPHAALVRSEWGVLLKRYGYKKDEWWIDRRVVQLSGPSDIRR